jgi:hypothetical protein
MGSPLGTAADLVSPLQGDRVNFVAHFVYSGPLRGLLALGTQAELLRGMTQENEDLKKIIEQRSRN